MVTVDEQESSGQRVLCAVRKLVICQALCHGAQHRSMGHASQSQDDRRLVETRQFLPEIVVTDFYFLCARLVLRRYAANGIGYPAIEQLQAVISGNRLGSGGEAVTVQGAVQEQTGVVAGERPARAIRAMQPGRKAHDKQACPLGPERRYWPRVIPRVLLSRGTDVVSQTGASPAFGRKRLDGIQIHHTHSVKCATSKNDHLTDIVAKALATEIRVGNLIELDKRVWRVLKAYHVHVGGRGGAFMQVEMKDVESGTKRNERIRTDEKVDRAFVETRPMQYLYQDGDSYVFMDKESYEQLTLPADFLEGQAGYLLPNGDVQVNMHNDRPIGIELPASVILTIVETEPGIKGATATGSYKPARTETGITVQVPQFVSEGEKIKVNTDSGEYMERAS